MSWEYEVRGHPLKAGLRTVYWRFKGQRLWTYLSTVSSIRQASDTMRHHAVQVRRFIQSRLDRKGRV